MALTSVIGISVAHSNQCGIDSSLMAITLPNISFGASVSQTAVAGFDLLIFSPSSPSSRWTSIICCGG